MYKCSNTKYAYMWDADDSQKNSMPKYAKVHVNFKNRRKLSQHRSENNNFILNIVGTRIKFEKSDQKNQWRFSETCFWRPLLINELNDNNKFRQHFTHPFSVYVASKRSIDVQNNVLNSINHYYAVEDVLFIKLSIQFIRRIDFDWQFHCCLQA